MNTQNVFDGLLVLQYQAGNKKALEQLVKRHHKNLCTCSYWYTKDIDVAKDIVQDCWGIVMSKINTLRDPNSFRSWITRIVIRKSYDYLKSKNLQSKVLKKEVSEEYEDNIDVSETRISIVSRAITSLSPDHQIVLRLFYTQEYSLKEISQILNVSVGTVKSRLFHAREKLKIILKEEL